MTERDPVIGSEVAAALAAISAPTPSEGWDAADWPTGRLAPPEPLQFYVAEAQKHLRDHGFVRLRLGPHLAAGGAETPSAVTSLVRLLASPIAIFRRRPFWREIAVLLDRPPRKSEGIGDNPLHMDFVNAECPPEFVFLFCLRPDPCGGGASLLADYSDVVSALPDWVTRCLAELAYADGRVVDLDHVGRDINPFAVHSATAEWPFRYTGNLLDAELSAPRREAIALLSQALRARQRTVALRHGDLLVADQRRVLHGREALGPNQHLLAPAERRHLRQAFARPWPVAPGNGTIPTCPI